MSGKAFAGDGPAAFWVVASSPTDVEVEASSGLWGVCVDRFFCRIVVRGMVDYVLSGREWVVAVSVREMVLWMNGWLIFKWTRCFNWLGACFGVRSQCAL